MLTMGFCFSAFASSVEDTRPTPLKEPTRDDELRNYKWFWLSDSVCIREPAIENTNNEDKDWLMKKFEYGVAQYWHDYETSAPKLRYTYMGTWSQDENDIWSFVFEDYTIPVGLTKIDGVLYAFTGYGELKEGYEYWNGLKTGADGVVTENSQEFLEYLSTQYLPECYTVSLAE